MKQIVRDVLVNHSSWRELENAIGNLELSKDKGDAFEFVASTYFLYFDRKFEVRKLFMRHEIPDDISRRLKLEGTDYGVDGVIERLDGRYTAYQVKFRASGDSPTFRELSTFWTEAEHADFRLIFANCEKLPRPVNNRANHLAVINQDLTQLSDSVELPKGCFFSFLTSRVLNTEKTKEVFAKPRQYQQEMLDGILSSLQSSNRTKVIAACGVGKTLLSKFIHDALESTHTIFMAPSLALIKQAIDEWAIKTEKRFLFLAVCSDQSVVNDEIDEIQLLSHEVNFPVTTNPKEISDFLNIETNLPKVVFSTYHSLDSIMMANIESSIHFDLGIFDEAHKTAGSKLSKQFTLAMEDEYIPIKKRVFMTATERVVTRKIQEFAVDRGLAVYSMDDVEKYGNVGANLNFGRAIKKGIIADYKIVVASITEKEAYAWMKTNKIVSSNGSDIAMENLFKKLLIIRAIKDLNITKVISYHSNIARAQEFTSDNSTISLQKIFNAIIGDSPDLKVLFGHVNGSMTASKRKASLDALSSSDLGLISNSKCLTEGVNVPVVDAVYFVDQKSSMIDIVQAIGRAVRKPGIQDKTAYIILPVILPDDLNNFSGINASRFEAIHEVIQALREADEDLAERIDELNYSIVTGRSSNYKNSLNGKIIHLPFADFPVENFERSLCLRVGEVNTRDKNELPLVTYTREKGSRKSSFKRKLTTIGDYNIDAYLEMVVKTIQNYSGRCSQVLSKKDLELVREGKVNHNNISHTERVGAITQVRKGEYRLTEIGNVLLNNPVTRKDIFTTQMLRYYTIDNSIGNNDKNYIFPYRAILNICKEFEYIRKLDFLYCVYALPDTSEHTILTAIDNIRHLQEAFPKLESLSDTNKRKVLEILNHELLNDGGEFSLLDVWSSRGTTYNQFNYFKKHLLMFNNVFVEGDLKDRIYLKKGCKTAIESLLLSTDDTFEGAIHGNSKEVLRDIYTRPVNDK